LYTASESTTTGEQNSKEVAVAHFMALSRDWPKPRQNCKMPVRIMEISVKITHPWSGWTWPCDVLRNWRAGSVFHL